MNTTVNQSTCNIPLNPTAEKIWKSFAFCLIFVVSLVGNSFIALIVYKTPSMRKPIDYFIVNMAMSDMLFPIFYFLPTLTELYLDSWLISGPLGLALCKLAGFLPNVSTIVSIQSLVLIAVDRFGAVVFPHRFPLISSKLCPFFIFVSWIIAMAVFSPYLIAKKLVKYPGQLHCELQWDKTFGKPSSFLKYVMSVNAVFFYIPVLSLALLYTIIFIKLKSQKIPGEQSTNAEQRHAKRSRNVLKMAIAIVLGFALCWVPYSIVGSLKLLARDSEWNCSTRYYGFIVVWMMALSNCAINPLICFIFSANYRHGFKRVISCFKQSQRIILAG